jgi:hypothetical protein
VEFGSIDISLLTERGALPSFAGARNAAIIGPQRGAFRKLARRVVRLPAGSQRLRRRATQTANRGREIPKRAHLFAVALLSAICCLLFQLESSRSAKNAAENAAPTTVIASIAVALVAIPRVLLKALIVALDEALTKSLR